MINSTHRNEASWQQRFQQLVQTSLSPELQAFYQAGVPDAHCHIHDVPMVAMDFETTGLDPEKDEIVSIGLVPFSLERIYSHQSTYWLVKPNRVMDDNAILIHGITHGDIEQAPSLTSVIPELLKRLAGKIVVVHYAAIEQDFLNVSLQRCIGERIELPLIDTFELERAALINRQGLIGKLLKQNIDSLRLSDCRKRYGLPHYRPHQAQTDALATAELLQAQIAYHYREDTAVESLWSR